MGEILHIDEKKTITVFSKEHPKNFFMVNLNSAAYTQLRFMYKKKQESDIIYLVFYFLPVLLQFNP